MAREIFHCPRCGEVMIYDSRRGFWKCPRCDGEFWDDESRLREIEEGQKVILAEEQLRQQARWCLGQGYTEVMPLVQVIDPKSRGSRITRKKKKPLPKQLPSQRYMLY